MTASLKRATKMSKPVKIEDPEPKSDGVDLRIKKFLNLTDSDITQIKKVGQENYRVNVYKRFYVHESVIPRTELSNSFYLMVSESLIKDLTIRQ